MTAQSFILFLTLSGVSVLAAAAPEPSADAANSNPDSPAASPVGNPVEMDPLVVTAQLDRAREGIVPELGATSFSVSKEQIADMSQGADAPFSQVLLRAPGVAQDSAANGDLHVRGEHGNLQYRINNVLLPEGISGYGLELDARFVDSLQLITGSLPAQYGFRTAGIVDIKTKSGAIDPGGQVNIYGGSYDTVRPSVQAGGSNGRTSEFVDATFDHNDLGIENPTPARTAVHDKTDQGKAFIYLSGIIDETSRLSFIGSASVSAYQVPDTPGLAAGTSPNGTPWLPGSFNSSQLDENQKERNYYGVLAYQKSAGDLNFQLSGFARFSDVHFTPDPVGDFYFNGVSSDVDRRLTSEGFQGDASYTLASAHTVRAGVLVLNESVRADSMTTVFPVDADGDAVGGPFAVADNHKIYGLFAGIYMQDEWKLTPDLTVNYGGRFDLFNSSFDNEHQVSPRLNLVYEVGTGTSLHAGYARYFTPPPVENVSGASVARFDATSNAALSDQDDPVRAERSDYFDAGVSRQILPGFQASVDAYYKKAKNQLDDGLFGQTLILSAFNYAEGRIYGVEVSSSYTRGPFSVYGNIARSEATGKDWVSAQFLFDPADLAYVSKHWIHLDHDQRLSGSFGASYRLGGARGETRFSADAIYGTGLRTDATAADGTVIPNGGSVPAYVTANVGVEKTIKWGRSAQMTFRFDIVNVADKSYELRDGSGVGVNAAQYGPRRGFFGSLGYSF